jgi:S-adenosylmethionine:tRNA ribosyltransferase-isomerase
MPRNLYPEKQHDALGTPGSFYNRAVLVADFDFPLPAELIAQEPLADRAAARLLHLVRAANSFEDRIFRDFAGLLRPGDLLVRNNTRVLPARLLGHRSGAVAQPLSPRNPAAKQFLRGRVELLLTRQVAAEPQTWQALVRPGRKVGVGEVITIAKGEVQLQAEVIARGAFGERTVRFAPVDDFFQRLDTLGHVPLPPYIDRPDRPQDREQYQTVYATRPGSVAAPTAGLHFTPEILERLRQRGVESAEITLHVGLGTFQPVRTEVVEQHRLHTEHYEISAQTAGQIERARREGRRIVAVGTTTVRTLEYAASRRPDGRIEPQTDEADIFIYPGFDFRVVSALLTNFHLPKSTLLMLVAAFAGREFILRAYAHAVDEGYRFFSYGDCMLIE